jgi:hypothetical protein
VVKLADVYWGWQNSEAVEVINKGLKQSLRRVSLREKYNEWPVD